MNIKSILMSSLLLAGSISASAQEQKKDFEYVFNPHWYVGVQGGAQYTLGEVSFANLTSFNAQVLVGYNFSKYFGARLGVNGWTSRAGIQSDYLHEQYRWKYNYVAPNLDFTMNLSNLFCGYNPKRVFNLGLFIGVGANIRFGNSEAVNIAKELNAKYPNWQDENGQNLAHLWEGTKANVQGRAGLSFDFRVSDVVTLGLEANANLLTDHYNSKKASNADWYFNGLAGIKINLCKTHTTREIPAPEPVIVEKVVEKVVEKKVPVEVKAPEFDPLRLDVFFTISSTKIHPSEQLKVDQIVAFLKKHPETKVQITGYADKGTGSAAGNLKLSEKRAQMVVDAIKAQGIGDDRIQFSTFKGDTEQPFDINDLNRVSICVVK